MDPPGAAGVANLPPAMIANNRLWRVLSGGPLHNRDQSALNAGSTASYRRFKGRQVP
jgi:hypothetical protein